MSYLLIKSLHVCAIILWIGGMVLQSLTLQLRVELHLLQKLRQWDRRVTTSAMLFAWITGLFLSSQGGWFGNRWLTVKLGFVVGLAGLHGMLAGQLRRRTESRVSNEPRRSHLALMGLLGLMAGIVLLVLVKPF